MIVAKLSKEELERMVSLRQMVEHNRVKKIAERVNRASKPNKNTSESRVLLNELFESYGVNLNYDSWRSKTLGISMRTQAPKLMSDTTHKNPDLKTIGSTKKYQEKLSIIEVLTKLSEDKKQIFSSQDANGDKMLLMVTPSYQFPHGGGSSDVIVIKYIHGLIEPLYFYDFMWKSKWIKE